MKKKIVILSILIFVLIYGVVPTLAMDNSFENVYSSETEFRALWISTLTSDISPYYGENSFKGEMNEVFAVMEHYKLNTMIFHIRTHNNALYNSKLNPVAGWWKNVNFEKFDPLEWLITECHKRGFEFHAWMNPYRLGNFHYYGEDLPAANPANDSSNIISSILNPGLPNVRKFLVDTVMEVIENYDVDAIHFDDYFYTNMGAGGALTGPKTILDEPDQATFIKYAGSYDTSSASDKADWRREQVNIFIEDLSTEIRKYNALNNRYVQLGISPTGIYNNGDGKVTYDENGKPITTGSLTSGQTHFSSYLFSDSLKWISEGWLDYILPQSYWATDHTAGSFYSVMDWWNKVVKHLDVNLYSGIGIYQADEPNRFGWNDDPKQLYKQLTYIESLEDVSGVCFYTYKHLKNGYKGSNNNSSKLLSDIGKTVWFGNKLIPEIKGCEPVALGKVSNFNITNNKLSWERLIDAKFYVIYRSNEQVMFSNDEIIAVVGSKEDLIIFEDSEIGNYSYGLKPFSYTNTLGEGAFPSIIIPEPVYNIDFYVDDELYITYKSDETFDLPEIPKKEGYDKEEAVWSKVDFSEIENDTRVDAIYKINKYEVVFNDIDGNIINTFIVEHGSNVIAPLEIDVDGYIFKGWDKSLNNITSDLIVNSIYEIIKEENNNNNEDDKNKEEQDPRKPFASCKEKNLSSLFLLISLVGIVIIKRRQ